MPNPAPPAPSDAPRAPKRTREIDDLTLARAKRGDGPALRSVIEHHERAVFALLSRMLVARASPALVEDLAQETFLKMCVALPRFDVAGPARFSTWLLTIAARTALDACKKSGREGRHVSLAPLDDDESGPRARPSPAAPERADASLARREARDRVSRAAGRLSDDQRLVLLLAEWHGFSHQEIARALDVEEGTVKSRLSRAKEHMRRALTEDTHGS